VLLIDRDPENDRDRCQQEQRLDAIAEQQVDRRCDQEQHEHRLGERVRGIRQERARAAARQLVMAPLREAPSRGFAAEPGKVVHRCTTLRLATQLSSWADGSCRPLPPLEDGRCRAPAAGTGAALKK
jgi:hypothetical protein